MVLDCPAVGTCYGGQERINSYFLLAEYRPLLHLLYIEETEGLSNLNPNPSRSYSSRLGP
jgi:hypothetical protein